MQRFGDGRDWFFEKRFGMFVHWGLYAIEAWHEQDQWRRSIPRRAYSRLIERWNPTGFDPEAWLDLLQDVGMEYLCVTAKHHDGFCLWDTLQTDYNVMRSPYGRDIIGLLADACHRRGVPLCLYYSIADWHHPNYPNQGRHHELPAPEAGDRPDWDAYMAFLKAQIRELCTGYGEIHGVWWDMNVPQHRDPSVRAMIRALQPKAVLTNRGFDDGDFATPERRVPEGRQFEAPTEACQSLGRESWGYRAAEDYYSAGHLMRSLGKTLAMGGNYLLNVGPTAAGEIPPVQAQLLRKVGRWYGKVQAALVAEPASALTENRDVLLTQRGSTLYVHLYEGPEASAVGLEPLDAAPRRATLLNTGAELESRVELTPRRWVAQWSAGLRGAAIRPALRVRGLPVDEGVGEPLVVQLELDRLP